jgi:hypothetical protein
LGDLVVMRKYYIFNYKILFNKELCLFSFYVVQNNENVCKLAHFTRSLWLQLKLDLIPEKFTLNPNDSNHYKITLKMDLNELKIFIEF